MVFPLFLNYLVFVFPTDYVRKHLLDYTVLILMD
jgi:hypothetical protein